MEICHVCDKILRVLRPQSEEERWAQLSLGSGREILQADMSCPAHEKLIISVLRSRADQPDREIYAMLDFIEVLDVHKNPLNNVTIITATMSRDSPFPRPPPYGIYPLREPNDALNLTCGRLLSSQWIDNGLPRLWKESCTKLHSNGLCNRAPYKPVAATRPTWVVDVVRQCLVIAPAWSSYVALSYVWGTQKPFQTTLATLYQNQQAGALSSSSIGKTIRDAMAVVKLMAERYLWVDALCIVQDDEMHKRSELARMAAIYANAIVTIIAMQGENANSGLKGFRGISESRRLCQSQHSLKNGAEVTQFPIDSTSLQLGSTKTAWWNISLISSLMAVYYAAAQQRVMGRLHDPVQIQGWIRGGPPKTTWDQVTREIDSELDPGLDPQLVQMIGRLTRGELSRDELTNMCFRPCVTAVLTISAPQTLLSSSLISLILGIGVYFGFIWTRALDKDAGHGDSKKLMIVYLVSLIVCFGVYSISHVLQDNDDGLEDRIVEGYVQQFIDRWGSALERADRARSDADPIASLMRSRPGQAAVSRTE